MSRSAKIFLSFASLVVAVAVLARFTGMLQYYVVPTISNEPNLKQNQKIYCTSLKTPERGDFIVATNPFTDTILFSFNVAAKSGDRYIYRLSAIEHDVIRMQDGVFFINGKNADNNLNLKHLYAVRADDALFFDKILDFKSPSSIQRLNDSVTILNLSNENVTGTGKGLLLRKFLAAPDTGQFGAFQWFNKNPDGWTIDNFGPLTVPAGCCFVLGDNRNEALDSRYAGFIKLSNIKGVKL